MFGEYILTIQGCINGLGIDDIEQCVLNCSKYIECSHVDSNYITYKVSAYPMILDSHAFQSRDDEKEEVHTLLDSDTFLNLYKFKQPFEFNEFYDALGLISFAFFLYKHRDREWAKRLLIETLKYITELYAIDIKILDSEEFLYDFVTKQLLELVSRYNMYDADEGSSYGLKFILDDVRLTTFGYHYLCFKDGLVRFYKCDVDGTYRDGTFWDDVKYLQLSKDIFVVLVGDMEDILVEYLGVFKVTAVSVEVLSELSFIDNGVVRAEFIEN